MTKKLYNEPTFKVVKTIREDILTTSETAFGGANGFETSGGIIVNPSQDSGEWNLPGVII